MKSGLGRGGEGNGQAFGDANAVWEEGEGSLPQTAFAPTFVRRFEGLMFKI